MTTLSKRATPSQKRIMRAIEGAVKNVADAHRIEFDPSYARSVAKRATGTLTASWPDVLAAKAPSKKSVRTLSGHSSQRTGEDCTVRRASYLLEARTGAVSYASHGSAPLRLLEKWMVRQMRDIKLSGNSDRANAFIDILRKISKLK